MVEKEKDPPAAPPPALTQPAIPSSSANAEIITAAIAPVLELVKAFMPVESRKADMAPKQLSLLLTPETSRTAPDYPSITNFLTELDDTDIQRGRPPRELALFAEAFRLKKFFFIDELVELSAAEMERMLGVDIGPGNANFLLKQARAEVAKVQKEAKVARQLR